MHPREAREGDLGLVPAAARARAQGAVGAPQGAHLGSAGTVRRARRVGGVRAPWWLCSLMAVKREGRRSRVVF